MRLPASKRICLEPLVRIKSPAANPRAAPHKVKRFSAKLGRATGKGGTQVVPEDEEEGVRLEDLETLITLFVSLVLASRSYSKPVAVSTVIRESAGFLSWVNKEALPLLSANFTAAPAQAIALLKSLQPVRRARDPSTELPTRDGRTPAR